MTSKKRRPKKRDDRTSYLRFFLMGGANPLSYYFLKGKGDSAVGSLLGCAALVVGVAGFFIGPTFYLLPGGLALQSHIPLSLVLLLSAALSLYLSITAWKKKRTALSYAVLLATAGLAGAVFGLMLFVLVLD